MKKVLPLGTILYVLVMLPFTDKAQTVSDYSVMVSATAQESPPQLIFTWSADGNATNYTIYRKSKTATSWSIPYGSVGGSATQFIDSNVAIGEAHEYRFYKNTTSYYGNGYIYAGIKVPAIKKKGTILLLIDSNYVTSLSSEISRLKWDLIGEGWQVKKLIVGRNDSVPDVKALIKTEYTIDTSLITVFLIGHIPVPYSGNIYPDGHTNHHGAWPADVFYGEMDGYWSDGSVNNTTSAWTRIHNVPADGKYDQSYLPSDLELEIGRVDLYNMTQFSLSDTLLVKQYLDKNHNFRTKVITAKRRGLIDDNFGLGAMSTDPFASNGWRNFSPMFGDSNIFTVDYFTTLDSQSYLWSFGCGGGSFTSAGGIGNTAQFASDTVQSIFTILFGSYFGDWDSQNNFLRAPLASKTHALTNFWGGRPHWMLHHMVLGGHIGYSTRLSQNNSSFYVSNYGGRMIHAALMGDPSLKMHIVAPPSVLVADSAYLDSAERISLNWTASADTVLGYYIYRSPNPEGPFDLISIDIVAATTYIDSFPMSGNNSYMVRAVVLETTGSGTYFNQSMGIFDSLSITFKPPVSVAQNIQKKSVLRIFPNPSHGTFYLYFTTNDQQNTVVKLFDPIGREVYYRDMGKRRGKVNTLVDVQLHSGIYICKIEAGDQTFYRRIVIR